MGDRVWQGKTCEQGQGWTAQQENSTSSGIPARHRPKIKSKNLKICFPFSLRTCFVSSSEVQSFSRVDCCLVLKAAWAALWTLFKVTGSRCWQDLLSGQGSCSGAVSSYVMAMPGVGFGSGLGAEHLTLCPWWYQSVKKMVSFNAAGLSIEWDNIAKCWQACILKLDSWLHHLGNFH